LLNRGTRLGCNRARCVLRVRDVLLRGKLRQHCESKNNQG